MALAARPATHFEVACLLDFSEMSGDNERIMTELQDTGDDGLLKDGSSLEHETPENSEARNLWAPVSLDAQAAALRYAVIPTLLISILIILFATNDRPVMPVLFLGLSAIAAALLLSSLLGALALFLRIQTNQAESLKRIAAVLESQTAQATGQPKFVHLPDPDVSETIREAIRERRWDDAANLLNAFKDAHPDQPEASRLGSELIEAQRAAREELLGKIEAARGVNEPERVLDLRDDLKPLIELETLQTLDRDLAKWFMLLIHRRLRAGSVGPEVAALAGRVAENLDATPEGASLRASLPTLRRAAGLCPRCAEPYRGIADACPVCLKGAPEPPMPEFVNGSEPDDPEDAPGLLDLNDPRALE